MAKTNTAGAETLTTPTDPRPKLANERSRAENLRATLAATRCQLGDGRAAALLGEPIPNLEQLEAAVLDLTSQISESDATIESLELRALRYEFEEVMALQESTEAEIRAADQRHQELVAEHDAIFTALAAKQQECRYQGSVAELLRGQYQSRAQRLEKFVTIHSDGLREAARRFGDASRI